MKIEGKEVKDFKDIGELASAVEKNLDNIVFELQNYAIEEREKDFYRPNDGEAHGIQSIRYLQMIVTMNQKFGTEYETRIDILKKHFKEPCKVLKTD